MQLSGLRLVKIANSILLDPRMMSLSFINGLSVLFVCGIREILNLE